MRQLIYRSILVFIVIFKATSLLANQCSNEIEADLQKLPKWVLETRDIQEDEVPDACIKKSMEIFFSWTNSVRIERAESGKKEVGHYAYCDSNNKLTKKHLPPCPTKNYINTISNTYNSVLKCLNFRPKDLFAITAVESGFQINTLSIAGVDIGIGQLTEVAVEDVNSEWDSFKSVILDSDNPHCERIKPFVENYTKIDNNLICSLTKLPDNPIRNLIYVGFLHFKNRDYMERLFSYNKIEEKVETLIGRTLADEELHNLKELLVDLSYNAGSEGAVRALNTYLESLLAPLEELKDYYDSLVQIRARLYLEAQTLYHSGVLSESEEKMNLREDLLNDLEAWQANIDAYKIPLEQFAITDKPESFGTFLVNNKISAYLDVLKNRVESVESSLGQPGLCTHEGYLEKL